MSHGALPAELAFLYQQRRKEIEARLREFMRVEEDRWFYELCFCLCTPQSSAVHASRVQEQLEAIDFYRNGQDILHILRDPSCYIRFHNTKHRRIHKARDNWLKIKEKITDSSIHQRLVRDSLAQCVDGIGVKEASHFLRNIGRRHLAIIDRHLLTNLVRCGVYEQVPSISTSRRYHEVEEAFDQYCQAIGIDMDEVDLLFWCAQTGHILK